MTNTDINPGLKILRQKAEKLLENNSSDSDLLLSKDETLKLVHELETYKIELEMQNDELLEAKEHAEFTAEKYTAFPAVATQTGPPACNTLLIQSGGSLTIASNGYLTVSGTLTNNAGTSGLVVQSGSGGTGSLLHNTNNVNATIQRYISGNGYHTVSVPLTSAASPTSNLFFGSYLYYFNETQTSPVDKGWVNMGNTTTASLDVTRGYMIYYPGANNTYSFSGPLNNGSFAVKTSFTSGAPIDNQGFNLVPNPYPSAIDWASSSGWTKTNIVDATWIWNPSAGNYSTYGSYIGTINGTRYIPVGQSFFVKATTGPYLSMDDNVRVHDATNFYKSAESIANLLRIKAECNNFLDEIVIYFKEGSSTSYEVTGDVQKMYGNEDAPQLSSLSSDNFNLTINRLPELGGNISVPLNFSVNASFDVTLTATNFDSFIESASIYLEDKVLNKIVNLKTSPVYAFSYNPSNPLDRFVLHFSGVNGTKDISAADGKVFISNGQIFIDVPGMEGKTTEISVYNLLGQNILTEHRTMDGIISVKSPINFGVYVVKVSSDNQHFTTKIVNK